jgi:SOS-response transcriptional repressor LexA
MSSNAALLIDEAPGAFTPEGETITVRVVGSALEALDVHDGDRVVVVKGRAPEFGDLAALRIAGGALMLWKVYPEGDDASGRRLHLSNGRGRWTVPAQNVETVGVIVAVLRRLGA